MKFSAFLLLLLPLAQGSVLGLKGLKGGKGGDHESGGYETHAPVAHSEPCHQEYDDVWEEKCQTVYEDKCTVEHKPQCSPTSERVCVMKEEEKCEYVPTQKCTSIPVPKCGIKWEKICSTHPKCQKHFEKICVPTTRNECHTEHEQVCSWVTETTCKRSKIHEEAPPLQGKGLKSGKGDKLGHLKGFLESLKGGEGHEAGHESHGPAPHVVPHESGHEGGGYGAPDSPHGHLFKRSVDESSDADKDHDSSEKKKLSPKEAYVLHKNSLVALKEQVDAEISALDKLNEAEVSKSTSSGAEHVLQKRSADGLKVHLLRRRSLETIREQINGEIALLEEGDYAAEIQEVYDRRRRTVNGMEILQKPEIKKAIEKLDAVQLQINEHLAQPVGEKSGKGRQRRSLKGDKGKGDKGKGAEWGPEECWQEPREKCASVPRQSCHSVPSEACRDEPREICTQEETCKDIPKKDCHLDYKEVCANIPTRQCRHEPKEHCTDVPRQVCHDVAHEICVPFPGKKCEKIIVKRPRTVCLPPQRVRVLDGPELAQPESHGSEEHLYKK